MTAFEENLSPYITLVESATPGSPAAGNRRLVVGTDHVLRWKDSAGLVSPMVALNKWDGTTAPTVNEDSGDGYAIGSRWIDTTNDKEYVCLDATVGAAVWHQTDATALSNPMTTTGDMIYSSDGSGTPARLGIGTAGKSLAGGTIPSWAYPTPEAYETFLTGDVTVVNANTAYDVLSLALGAGYWWVEFQVTTSSANANPTHQVAQIYNGSAVLADASGYHSGGAGGGTHFRVGARVDFSGGAGTVKGRLVSLRGSSDTKAIATALANGTTNKATSLRAFGIKSL